LSSEVAGSLWWATGLHEKLSQGDVIAALPIFLSSTPVQPLRHATMKGGVSGWMAASSPVRDRDGREHFLGVGRITPAVVLSHSCELDKEDRGKRRVTVAPIAPISSVGDPAVQEAILAQGVTASMPLPEIPSLGTCYADLRSMTTLDRRVVDAAERLASMTPEAERRLQAQLVAFLVRLDLPPPAKP